MRSYLGSIALICLHIACIDSSQESDRLEVADTSPLNEQSLDATQDVSHSDLDHAVLDASVDAEDLSVSQPEQDSETDAFSSDPEHDSGPEPMGSDASLDPDAQATPDAHVVEPGLQPGLLAEYFAQYRVPVLQRIEASIDHEWGQNAPHPDVPADFFAARWTGFIQVPDTGDYTIWVVSDDGVRVWIDDELVIDAWRFQAPERYEVTRPLVEGRHTLRVEYMERTSNAVILLGWSSESIDERPLGVDELLTTGEPAGLPSPRVPYINPVVGRDCPDPGVIRDESNGMFYAICTGGPFFILRSPDLIFWENTGAVVFPEGKPAWADNGRRNWAPEIHKVRNRWVVYYTTVNAQDRLSIGAAFSDSPTGPYQDLGTPLVEHPRGVIDAHYFLDDDGRHYLTYKIDGNASGRPTPIFLRELAPDGLSFAEGSEQVELIRNNPNNWEGGVVEAQWLVKRNGQYYLFYSGNVYDHRYRTGVAKAARLTGPYQKRGAPILSNNQRWVGPGHGSVVRVHNEDIFVYHAWPANEEGTHAQRAGRHILADRIRWEGEWPSISNGTPSTDPQPPFQ